MLPISGDQNKAGLITVLGPNNGQGVRSYARSHLEKDDGLMGIDNPETKHKLCSYDIYFVVLLSIRSFDVLLLTMGVCQTNNLIGKVGSSCHI